MPTTYSRTQGDRNLFYHTNRGAQMKPLKQSENVPRKFGETSLYHNDAEQAHPLAKERGGDRSAHYRLLRLGVLPETPTFRRRIYTDMDPLTRIEESIPITREERKTDQLVKGVADISSSMKTFLEKSGTSFEERQQAAQLALRTMLERYNVPMEDLLPIIANFSPRQAVDLFDDLERRFEREGIDTTDAERIIKDQIKIEAEHKHEEKKMVITEEEEKKKPSPPKGLAPRQIRELALTPSRGYGRPVGTTADGRQVFEKNGRRYVYNQISGQFQQGEYRRRQEEGFDPETVPPHRATEPTA